MIRGLEHFKKHMRQYTDSFILVGGVAGYLQLEEVGASKVRPTKDLDIVLIMKPSDEFLRSLREYINNGGYEIQKGVNDEANFYRFQKPEKDEYPVMIELFAAVDDEIELFEAQHIIPVNTPKNAESLSAILLDEEYYLLIKKNTVEKDGIKLLNPFALIPFKAKAYLEIKERGEDSKQWKKHRADIINIAVNLLDGEQREILTGTVRDHFLTFMDQLRLEITPDVVFGACKQKVAIEDILLVLEKTFLE